MIVNVGYEVGDKVLVFGSNDHWKIKSIHTSVYEKHTDVFFDIEKNNGLCRIIQTSSIKKLVE